MPDKLEKHWHATVGSWQCTVGKKKKRVLPASAIAATFSLTAGPMQVLPRAALLLAALPTALSMGPGQSLLLNWCAAASPQQAFSVNAAAGTVVDAAPQKLCVTQSSPYPAALTMELCDGSASQQWRFNASAQWPLPTK